MKIHGSTQGWGLLALCAAFAAGACGHEDPGGTALPSSSDNADVSTIVFALTNAPADVRCMRISVAGSQTVTRSFDVTPGQSSTLAMTGLPLGNAIVNEDAFDAACANVGPTTAATWVSSAPTPVTLASGQQTAITIVLRRPSALAVTSDFMEGSSPALVLTPSTRDFGGVQLGATSAPGGFSLSNTTASPLGLTTAIVGTNPPEFSIVTSGCSTTLAPGASCALQVAFTPGSVGQRTGTLQIGAGAGVFNASLSGTGTPMGTIVATPSQQEFGSIVLGTSSAPFTLTLNNTNLNTVSFTPVIAGTDAAEFSIVANACPTALASGASCTVQIAFTPAAVGQRLALLQIMSSVGIFNSVLEGFGKAMGTIVATPSQQEFGSIVLGTSSAPFTLTLNNTNLNTVSFTPVIAGTDAAEFSIVANACPAALASGASCTLQIAFTPAAVGQRLALLQVMSSVGIFNSVLEGFGKAAASVSLTPGSANLGNIVVAGQSGSLAFTLTNASTATIPAPTAAMTGTNATDFVIVGNACTGASLAPGQACSIQVVFAPTAAGSRSATLAVSAPAASAALTGTGVAWSSQDVGAVGAAGSFSAAGGVYTVKGSGADVWGAADELRYVFHDVSGDATITARVSAVQNTNDWAKVGLMMRDGTTADARNVFAFVSPLASHGYRFQARVSAGGATTTAAAGAGTTAAWLRLVRRGNTFTGFFSSTGGATWSPLGDATSIAMPASIGVGLALCSHSDGTLNTSTFDNVVITQP